MHGCAAITISEHYITSKDHTINSVFSSSSQPLINVLHLFIDVPICDVAFKWNHWICAFFMTGFIHLTAFLRSFCVACYQYLSEWDTGFFCMSWSSKSLIRRFAEIFFYSVGVFPLWGALCTKVFKIFVKFSLFWCFNFLVSNLRSHCQIF